MTIAKGELKAIILHDQGVLVDDMLESALRRVAVHDGAKQALSQFSKTVAELARLVDRDVEQGLIATAPAELAAYVKRYIERAALQADAAAKAQANQQIAASGEVVAYQRMVSSLQGQIKAEQERTPPAGADGHPGDSVAAARKAEVAPPPKPKRKYTKRGD